MLLLSLNFGKKDKMDLSNYLYGRCHLFALVAAKILNQPITIVWDLAAYDDLDQLIDRPCLVHAFIHMPDGAIFDADGMNTDPNRPEDNYPCNEASYATFSIEKFEQLIEKEQWGSFNPNEEQELEAKINQML